MQSRLGHGSLFVARSQHLLPPSGQTKNSGRLGKGTPGKWGEKAEKSRKGTAGGCRELDPGPQTEQPRSSRSPVAL